MRLVGLAEAGAADGTAEVFAAHFDHDTHFGEAGAHAFADAVTEGFFAHGAAGAVAAVAAGRQVGVVGGDEGGAFIVVTSIEYQGHGVPDPVSGFGGTELVDDEDFGVEDGAEDFQLGGSDLGVVGVLDLLEKLAVVAEEAVDSFFDDESLEDADGEMSFADADGACEQEAATGGGYGIAIDEAAGHEVGGGEGAIGAGEAGLVAVEGTVFVAGGDGGAVEEAGDALLSLAFAGFDFAAAAGERSNPHTHSATSETNAGHGRISIAGWTGWKRGRECGGGDEVGSSGAEEFAEAAVVCVEKRDGGHPEHAEVRGDEDKVTGAEAEAAGEGFNAAPAIVKDPHGQRVPTTAEPMIMVMRGVGVCEEVVNLEGQDRSRK